nr:4-alpha-glucanotransferase [Lachnospiraceae bacterium]
MRSSGILLPVASLPSPYGVGTLGKAAYDFVDFLKTAGQKYWQVLPMGPTSYGDSPYQSFCTFAGNPYFIDPDMLVDEGLLTKEECKAHDAGEDPRYVDYGKLYNTRFSLLHKAFDRAEESLKKNRAYKKFKKENSDWLDEYSLFMALKDANDGRSWIEWDEPIRNRQKAAVKEMTAQYAREIEYYKFMQFSFFTQWDKLKKYANDNGIKIIGDIPIYVAFDSSDA